MKSIITTISKGRQSLDYKEVLSFKRTRNKIAQEHRLQVRIKSDSYDFQSHAVIERWNGDEWKQVHSIHYAQMQTIPKLIHVGCNQPSNLSQSVIKNNNMRHFQKDRDELVRIAKEIL